MSNMKPVYAGVTWVVVADAARAEIYSRQLRRSRLEHVESFNNELARVKQSDLVTDGLGRTFDSAGPGRHAMAPDHSIKETVRGDFARHIADALAAGRKAGHFAHLVLIAAPAMLGDLRARLDHPTAACIALAIDKEYTERDPASITALIDSRG